MVPVAEVERDRIGRKVILWLNSFPGLPEDLSLNMVVPESHLKPDVPGMAVSAITTAYIKRAYIVGGYQAEYQFVVIYRVKPGVSMEKTLKADELLNQLGDWASRNKPDLGAGIRVMEVIPTAQAELYALYESGDEDHHIPIKITYEVI